LLDRFPHLNEVPRVALRTAPTPVEQVGDRLWIKRDDLTADPIGGNKVRALEFLLGEFPRGSHVITGGSRGSTHVLATVIHARALGIEVTAASWPQEMNDVAKAVDARVDRATARRHFRSPVSAALWITWQTWRGRNVIPAGGTTPRGMLGYVNAGLELGNQVKAGLLPEPDRIVVPLGTGGTVAGLAVGLALSGLRSAVVGARVVPRIVANRPRIRRLIRACLKQVDRSLLNDEPSVAIAQGVYGGAYGRVLPGSPSTARDIPLDPTYSAKAFVEAMDSSRTAKTLFWLTFDSRWMTT
jgi:1-aminocyclopropane-1-carboxylate deaminase/D-cysteine desulfhydrase-like pyridoxal-dependent ACC family enzyme